MVRVLFVCLGNICRSPMAEGLFRNLVESRGLSHRFHIDSAGTASYHIGELPDKRARQVCRENGIELTHRAQAVQENHFEQFDFMVAMDTQNLADLERMQKASTRTRLLMFNHWNNMPVTIPDPYYGSINGFYEVYDLVHRQNLELLEYLLKHDA